MKSLLILLSLLFTLVLSGCKEGTIVYDIEFPRADSPEAQPIPPVVSLQTSSSNLAENAGTVLVNITLNKTISSTTTVTLSLSGSATLNRDYRIDSTTLQIPAGSLSASTTLRSIDDSTDDDAETIILDIVSVSGGEGVAEAGTQQDIVTITDDEGTPAVTLSTSASSFTENAADPAITLTLSMTIASTDNTTIQLSTSGTATGGGTDYSLTNRTLVIPAGSTSMTTTILTNDDPYYDDGETIIVEISSVSGSTAAESGNQSETITINDDEAQPTVSLMVGADNITEATGTGDNTTVTATLSYANSSAVLVSLSLSGSATQGIGNDYTIDNTTIEIPAGSLNANTTLRSQDDLIDDDAESIIIDISSVSGGDSAAANAIQQKTVTIIDNDTASISLSKNTATVSENGTIANSFSVMLTSEPTANVTVTVGDNDSTEVSASPTTLTFSSGNWSIAQWVILTGRDDNVSDDNQTTLLTLAPSGGDYGGVSSQSVTVTTTDNDTAGFTLSKNLATVSEDGTLTDSLSVMLTSEPTGDVTLSVTDNDTSEVSYSPSSLVFGSGNWSTAQTITLTGLDDSIVDDNQTTLLTLAPSGGDYGGVSSQTVRVTTTDNDTAGFRLSQNTAVVSETGTTDTLTVVLTSEPIANVTLTLNDNDSGTEVLYPSSVVFSTGNWSTAQTITLTGLDDNIVDDNQTTLLTLNPSTSADSNYSGLSTQTVTVTTTDNDTSEITLDNVTVSEGAGVATMTLTLSNPVSSAVTVDLSTLDIGYPADNGTDFSEVLGKTLSIPALATALQDNITILQDTVAEDNETFGVSLNNPSHGSVTVGGSVVVTITDDEARPSVTLSPSSTSVVESVGTVTLIVSQSVKAATDTIVTLSLAGTADNGTDYTLSSDAITISAGSLSENATLTITDDSSPESSETILVDVLSVAGGNGATDGATQQTITITDNDAPTVNLSASLTTITEGDTGTQSVTITATLSSTATTDTTVTLTPTGTANGSGADYTLNSSTINVLSGNLTGSTTIDVVGDYIDEDNETIVLDINTVSGGGGASENGTQQSTITIIDNDNSSLIVTPVNITVNEASTTTNTFTVKLSSQPNGNVVLNLNANDNTEATITSLTSISFDNTNWNDNQTIIVQAIDDSEVDDNVSSTITLSIDTSSTTDNIYDLLDNQTVTVITIDDDTSISNNLTLTGEPDIVRNILSWNWDSDPNPEKYYIYWSNTGIVDFNSNKTPEISSSKDNYTHGGLDNITYYYRIAVEKSGITTFFPSPSDSPLALTPKPVECSSSYNWVPDNDTDLIAYYPFETNMEDYSTQSSPGTGHPYHLVPSGNEVVFGDGCAYGQAAYFDGDLGTNSRDDGSWGGNDNFTDSNVSIPDNWTLSLWVNPDSDMGVNHAAFASGGSNGINDSYGSWFQIDYTSDGEIGIDGGSSNRLGNKKLEIGIWYHFAVVQYSSGIIDNTLCSASGGNCTDVKFYVNGKEYDSASKWHAKWGGSGDKGIKIGLNRGGKKNWKGYIDEVKIYKRAFESNEIANLYSKSLPPIVEDFDVQDNTTYFGFQLDLSWTPVPGATSYNIFRDNASGITIDDLYKTISINGASPSATCSTSSCVFFDNSTVTGKTYYYRMTAVNDIGFGNIAPAAEKSECVGSCTP